MSGYPGAEASVIIVQKNTAFLSFKIHSPICPPIFSIFFSIYPRPTILPDQVLASVPIPCQENIRNIGSSNSLLFFFFFFFCGHPQCLLCSSQEFEEEQEEEWKTFVPAPRNTEADELNDLKSLQRKLQETLVLLVKKEKDSPSWEPPLAEVMFDTSETLQQVYEGNLLIQIWGPFLERIGN